MTRRHRFPNPLSLQIENNGLFRGEEKMCRMLFLFRESGWIPAVPKLINGPRPSLTGRGCKTARKFSERFGIFQQSFQGWLPNEHVVFSMKLCSNFKRVLWVKAGGGNRHQTFSSKIIFCCYKRIPLMRISLCCVCVMTAELQTTQY